MENVFTKIPEVFTGGMDNNNLPIYHESKTLNMREINLITIDWNNYNGFTFKILELSFRRFEGTLLGMCFAFKEYFTIDILFFQIEIKSPFV